MNHGREMEERGVAGRYLRRQLSAEAEVAFADHYLECPVCVEQIETAKSVVAALRAAQDAGMAPEPRRRAFWFIPWPAWGLAAALGLTAIYVGVTLRRPVAPGGEVPVVLPERASKTAPVVTLRSFRSSPGAESNQPAAQAGKPFRLRLDLRGVPPAASYQVALVTDSGERVWSQTVAAAAGAEWLEALVEGARLSPGSYWVRILVAGDDGRARQLREYPLTVAP